MPLLILLTIYCLLIVVASVVGGRLPSMIRMTHLRTQLLMSFVGGLMLGIATLHLLPHAAASLGSPERTGLATLIGVVAMFLLLRAFHPHGHGDPAAVEPLPPTAFATPSSAETPADGPACGHAGDLHESHVHGDHGHHVGHDSHCGHGHAVRGYGWVGMVFGLGLHTLVDGVALSASVVADAEHGAWLGLAGLGTFLAVALHKPLDAFAITSTMRAGGWSMRMRDGVNLAFAMACPAGAALFYLGATQVDAGESVLGWGLAVSAGFFLCIALGDLLPEVSFHDHDRGKLTAALCLGIALAVAVEHLPGHSHEHHPPAGSGEVGQVEDHVHGPGAGDHEH
jgi:zinc and cadmium transporter